MRSTTMAAMRRCAMIVNDKMRQGYSYVPGALAGRSLDAAVTAGLMP